MVCECEIVKRSSVEVSMVIYEMFLIECCEQNNVIVILWLACSFNIIAAIAKENNLKSTHCLLIVFDLQL